MTCSRSRRDGRKYEDFLTSQPKKREGLSLGSSHSRPDKGPSSYWIGSRDAKEMKLFVTVTERGLVSVYIGPKSENRKSELDEEAQFLELKIAFPEVRGNLELWKNFVEEQNFYGLWVNVDHDRSCIDYLPLMEKDYDALVTFFEE